MRPTIGRTALAAVGLLAVGTATGLSAHGLLQTSAPATTPAGSDLTSTNPAQPIPMMTAPNYRAIVSRNQAAVVGIPATSMLSLAAKGRP